MATATVDSLATKAKLFRGFADPSRLSIVEALRAGPLSVTDIVDATGLTQSNTSNHLACLLDCGLVHKEQRGRLRRRAHSIEQDIEAFGTVRLWPGPSPCTLCRE